MDIKQEDLKSFLNMIIDTYYEKKDTSIKNISTKNVLKIDYSKITCKETRNQLKKDLIEMDKYTSKINFKEFCKYAHFQAEGLINYYYTEISNGDIDTALDIIKKNNKGFDKYLKINNRKYSDLTEIDYGYKLYAISNEVKLYYTRMNIILGHIKKVRNRELHRGKNKKDENLEKFIENQNFAQVEKSIICLKDKIIMKLKQLNNKSAGNTIGNSNRDFLKKLKNKNK